MGVSLTGVYGILDGACGGQIIRKGRLVSERDTPTPDDLSHDAQMGRALDEYLKRQAGGGSDSPTQPRAQETLPSGLRETLEFVADLQLPEQLIASLVNRGVLERATNSGYLATFGEYRIISLLGRGGMGIVLKALDGRLRRVVALKILRPEFAGERAALQRFEREAQAAAALQHPNIVTVYTVGEHRGAPFISMEYVDGVNLAELIRMRGSLPPGLTRHILRELMEGLCAAHTCGLTHRDVKSSNILLGGDGLAEISGGTSQIATDETIAADSAPRRDLADWHHPPFPSVRLADFGLARIRSSQTQLTVAGSVLGTPDYMSPEQARGDENVDHRTDLYSAGVVLYEMLTGRTPFKADTPTATIRRILDEEPAHPRTFRKDVDPVLASLATRLLAKNRRDRPASCAEVLRLLDASVPIRPLIRWRYRRRATAALLTLGLFGMLIATWVFVRRPSFQVTDARVDPESSNTVQVRQGDETEWHRLRVFSDLNADALVDAVPVHAATGDLVVVGLRQPLDSAGSVLVALGPGGKELWQTALHTAWDWPDCESRARWWHVKKIVAANLDGRAGDELLAVAQDADNYPTRISTIDPVTGRVQQTFWHAGHILDLRVIPNLLGQGQPGILAWGIDNKLDKFDEDPRPDDLHLSHWDLVPVLMVLDPRELAGVSPPLATRFARLAGAAPHAYALVDRPGGHAVSPVGTSQPNADGPALTDSTRKWQIDHAELTPRQIGPDPGPQIQVQFEATSNDGTRIPIRGVIVDTALNLRALMPAHNADPTGDELVQFQQWWRPVIQDECDL